MPIIRVKIKEQVDQSWSNVSPMLYLVEKDQELAKIRDLALAFEASVTPYVEIAWCTEGLTDAHYLTRAQALAAERAYKTYVSELEEGDMVILYTYADPALAVVEHVTSKAVVVNGWHFNRSNGNRVGKGPYCIDAPLAPSNGMTCLARYELVREQELREAKARPLANFLTNLLHYNLDSVDAEALEKAAKLLGYQS